MVACEQEASDLCSTDIPVFLHEIENAYLSFGGDLQSSQNQRSIASVWIPDTTLLPERDVLHWERWAFEKLTITQLMMDSLDKTQNQKSLKKDVSWIADQWVSFFGYVENRQIDKMVKVLKKIHAQSGYIYENLCKKSGPRS